MAAACFCACAARQPEVNVAQAQANTLALQLAVRDHAVDSLQTPAVMEYSGPAGHFKAREQITVRRPASLRVEAMSPLGVALVVAADGGQVAIFDPAKNTLMRGPASAATLDRFAQIPMAPQQAVRLILALSPESALLAFPPSSSHDEGDSKVLSYARANGASDELGFAGSDLVMVREKSPDGQVLYEVRYSDYRDIGALKFPYQVDASFPAAGTTLKLRYERPIIDGDIPDALFVLSPGADTRQMNLSVRTAPPVIGAKG
jgi:hypothetical protein